MITPKISLIAMESRKKSHVFVRVPNERGRWALAPRCVVEVPCPFCKSAVGELCKSGKHTDGSDKYWMSATHWCRATDAKRTDIKRSKPHIILRG